MDDGRPSWYELLPPSLRADYDRAVEKERLTNYSELGLYSLRIGQLVERLESGGALANVSRLREVYLAMMEVAAKGGDPFPPLQELASIIEDVENDRTVWQELFETLESKSRVLDKETKSRKAISREKADRERVEAIERFFDLARNYIKDRDSMKQFASDIEVKVLGRIMPVKENEAALAH